MADEKEIIEDVEVETKEDIKPTTDTETTAEKTAEDENVSNLLKDAEGKVDALTKELENLQTTNAELSGAVTELESVKTDLTTANDKLKEYETLLTGLVDEKVKKIPEELQDLLPCNMTLSQKLEWITKAESKNVFKDKKKVDGVEIGKPIGASVENIDTADMSSTNILSMAYNMFKK